jgi:dTDP-4-dehydrorhamnose reductase
MKLLLLGRNGQLGWELQRALAPLGELTALGSDSVDLGDTTALRSAVRETAPAVIVNAAAYTAVDKAESDAEQARRINADAVGVLAEEADRLGAWLVHYSTDYVFDGTKASPYCEDDPTHPLSVYGTTKLQGEQAIRSRHARHLIFRTSWVYAARGGNFAKTMLRLAAERTSLRVVADQHGTPTSAELLADITVLALYRVQCNTTNGTALAGTYHVAASGETTWHEYARYVVGQALARGATLRCAPEAIEPIPSEAYPVPALRPKNSRLDTTKLRTTFGVHLPDWRYYVARLIDELSLQGVPWHAKA